MRSVRECSAGHNAELREAFVIAAVMRGRQIEHRQRAGAQRFDFGKRFLLVPVADPAAGTDPDRAGLFDNRQQRRRQSPRHRLVRFCARDTRLETTTRFTESPPVDAQ